MEKREDNEIRDVVALQKRILDEIEDLREGDFAAETFGQRLADRIVRFVGSWKFIVIQSSALLAWIVFNSIIALERDRFDPYPYVLLNLVLSFQAAFASPVILMAGNRTEERDRRRATEAYRSIERIEKMLVSVDRKVIRVRKKRANEIRRNVHKNRNTQVRVSRGKDSPRSVRTRG